MLIFGLNLVKEKRLGVAPNPGVLLNPGHPKGTEFYELVSDCLFFDEEKIQKIGTA